MKIAIIGFGVEGQAAYNYWNTDDNQLSIRDLNERSDFPAEADVVTGEKYLYNLDEYDLIVRSAGINPNQIISANGPEIKNKITSIVNEFLKVSPTKNIIGVTGTKGKGTTSSLVAKLLEGAGHKVHLGGNIGVGALALLNQGINPDDIVVLELSSFQLVDVKSSPHIAVCLMIVPEHLNWHADMEEYVEAKSNIFRFQKPEDIAIYYGQNNYSERIAGLSAGKKVPYYKDPGVKVDGENVVIGDQVICSTTDTKLLGKHNLQNICAALSVFWQFCQDAEIAKRVIQEFKGLNHRLEYVKTVRDIKYFNDSYASVPDATIAALASIPGPKTLIIGGFDRNLDLDELANSLNAKKSEIRKVILIGASANRTALALDKVGFTEYIISDAKTMPEVVDLATKQSIPGDSIILSPGFPSFDMFKNFEDRGIQFKSVVAGL